MQTTHTTHSSGGVRTAPRVNSVLMALSGLLTVTINFVYGCTCAGGRVVAVDVSKTGWPNEKCNGLSSASVCAAVHMKIIYALPIHGGNIGGSLGEGISHSSNG